MKVFTTISWEEVCSTKQVMAGQGTKMIPPDQALTSDGILVPNPFQTLFK